MLTKKELEIGPIRAFLPCAVGYKRHCSFIPFNYAVQKRRRFVRESYYTVRSLAKTRPSPLVVETEVTISRGAIGGTFDAGAT